MTEERQVAVREHDLRGTALERYGERAVARELMRRLMMLHPAAREVGEQGMLAAAQLAIVVGANPMPSTNEIHIWMDKGRANLDLGINFFRRRANELGGIYWVDDPRVMTDQEREQYGVERDCIGAIAKGARLDKVYELLDRGLPWEAAVQGVTRIGIGTVHQKARAKEGRPLSWTALKAAEKDLCRALFPNFEQPPAPEHWLEVVPNGNGGNLTEPDAAENMARMQAHQAVIDAEWEAMSEGEQQDKFEQNVKVLRGDPGFKGFDDEPQQGPDWDTAPEQPEPTDNSGEPEAEVPATVHNPHELLEALGPLAYYKNGRHALNALNKVKGTDLKNWPADPAMLTEALTLLTNYANEQKAQAAD